MIEWIDSKDKMPEVGDIVLAYSKEPKGTFCQNYFVPVIFEDGIWFLGDCVYFDKWFLIEKKDNNHA